MNNILKTFEIFWMEPLSVLRRSFLQLVNVQTASPEVNIFAQKRKNPSKFSKSSISVDFLKKKTQITVVNNERMYRLFNTVLYKQKMRERQNANAR